MEILACERTGDVLGPADRFWYLISHPPFTNLFDALNFTAWAMMVRWLLMQRKFVELGGAAHGNADSFRLELESICAAVGLDAARPAQALGA